MKDTTLIYNNYLDKFSQLTDEQFGKLMRATLQYSASGEETEFDDLLISLAFNVVKYDIDMNNEKYQKVCEARAEAGRKGGLAKASKASKSNQKVAKASKASKSNQKVAKASNAKQKLAKASKASKGKQSLANLADNDNDNDNDYKKNIFSSENIKEKASNASKASDAAFWAPTLEQTEEYFKANGLKKKASRFFNYYQARGWEGITDWQALADAWELNHIDDSGNTKKPQFHNFEQRDYNFRELEAQIINSG